MNINIKLAPQFNDSEQVNSLHETHSCLSHGMGLWCHSCVQGMLLLQAHPSRGKGSKPRECLVHSWVNMENPEASLCSAWPPAVSLSRGSQCQVAEESRLVLPSFQAAIPAPGNAKAAAAQWKAAIPVLTAASYLRKEGRKRKKKATSRSLNPHQSLKAG